jgi:hypothetical protein
MYLGTPSKSPPDESFDVIVIGSSPAILAEALYLDMRGYSVAVVEKRERLGGAWYTMPVWEFDSVQIGCHYIELGQKARAFLQDILGVPLEPMSVKAVWFDTNEVVLKDDALPRKIARRLLTRLLWGRYLSDDLWEVIKSLREKNPLKFFRSVKSLIVSPPYLYPPGGARQIVDALAERVASSSIRLLDNSCVEYVEIGTETRPNLCCINGRIYSAKSVVLGRHVYPRLQTSHAAGEDSYVRNDINVLLRVAGKKGKAFDYLEIYGNDIVRRVQDVTAFAQARRHGSNQRSDLLICCNLTKSDTEKSTVDATLLFEHLLELNVLDDGARLLDYCVERYPVPLTKEFESTDFFRVIDTYDMGASLERNADRWRAVFQQ